MLCFIAHTWIVIIGFREHFTFNAKSEATLRQRRSPAERSWGKHANQCKVNAAVLLRPFFIRKSCEIVSHFIQKSSRSFWAATWVLLRVFRRCIEIRLMCFVRWCHWNSFDARARLVLVCALTLTLFHRTNLIQSECAFVSTLRPLSFARARTMILRPGQFKYILLLPYISSYLFALITNAVFEMLFQ